MNLTSAFADAAQRHSTKTAIFWGDEEHSFESLFTQATQLAAHLQLEMGVQPGDRVGLWLKNCPQFVPALFAVLACGAVVVPINNFLKPDEVAHILADAASSLYATGTLVSRKARAAPNAVRTSTIGSGLVIPTGTSATANKGVPSRIGMVSSRRT